MIIPRYWGGMILDELDTAYRYENFLKNLLERRYKKYSQHWSLFVGMSAMYKWKKARGSYKNTFMWPMPEDPLVYIDEDVCYWEFLRLSHKKINILRLECYKYARRNRMFPYA